MTTVLLVVLVLAGGYCVIAWKSSSDVTARLSLAAGVLLGLSATSLAVPWFV